MAAPVPVLQVLWNKNAADVRVLAKILADRSLAEWSGVASTLRLHSIQLDYVRSKYPGREALELIHGALRLSAHVLDKDPFQFASQMIGRLLIHRDTPAILQFLDAIAVSAPKPWLRPLTPALYHPGTSGGTVERHSGRVTGVALTPDGKCGVSVSHDRTIKVWDTGRMLQDLQAISNCGSRRPIGPRKRGRRVSASPAKTLEVSDSDTGKKLQNPQGHSGYLTSVAVTPDGKRVVSASADKTLKVWDPDTGQVLLTLEGHSDWIHGV
jgi:hypothetical protein